jgi:hypothetical protein
MAGTDFKTTRQRLAKRRDSVTFAQQAGGLYFTATASRFDDGSLGEIFLHNHNADLTASNKSFETRELQHRWHSVQLPCSKRCAMSSGRSR